MADSDEHHPPQRSQPLTSGTDRVQSISAAHGLHLTVLPRRKGAGNEALEPPSQLSSGHVHGGLPPYSKGRQSHWLLPNSQRVGRTRKQFASIYACLGS